MLIRVKVKFIQKPKKLLMLKYFDEAGKERNTFQTGENILVRVYFTTSGKNKLLNFGIAIFSVENHYILGINTFIDSIDTRNYMKQGYFEVEYKNIPLRNNSYYIQAGIFSEKVERQLDYLSRSKLFRIFSKDKNQGIVDLAYEWK